MEDYEDLGSTIFGYGIPDFSHVSPDDPVSSARLIKIIELAVRFHEPRVIDPVVKIVGLASESSLSITLEGDVLVENRRVRLKFFGPDKLFQ
jgi:predicted component of type VI protein secretion system|tara:strand:- start:2130 stop:2405 length:276 start_codon:yes stop_codon:yes gene_type:complete